MLYFYLGYLLVLNGCYYAIKDKYFFGVVKLKLLYRGDIDSFQQVYRVEQISVPQQLLKMSFSHLVHILGYSSQIVHLQMLKYPYFYHIGTPPQLKKNDYMFL